MQLSCNYQSSIINHAIPTCPNTFQHCSTAIAVLLLRSSLSCFSYSSWYVLSISVCFTLYPGQNASPSIFHGIIVYIDNALLPGAERRQVSVPYIKQPKWATQSEKFVLSSAYSMLLVAAFLTMIMPLTPECFWFGLVQALCSASAIFGIISGRYRWEWVPLPVLIACQLISAILLYPVVSPFFVLYMLVVMFFLGRRGIHLTVVAHYLRQAT